MEASVCTDSQQVAANKQDTDSNLERPMQRLLVAGLRAYKRRYIGWIRHLASVRSSMAVKR